MNYAVTVQDRYDTLRRETFIVDAADEKQARLKALRLAVRTKNFVADYVRSVEPA